MSRLRESLEAGKEARRRAREARDTAAASERKPREAQTKTAHAPAQDRVTARHGPRAKPAVRRKLAEYRRKRDFIENRRAVGQRAARRSAQDSSLRHPEARGEPSPLRLSPRARRRDEELGRAQGAELDPSSSGSRCRSRIIRSTTTPSRGRSRKASTAAARSCSGIAAPTPPRSTTTIRLPRAAPRLREGTISRSSSTASGCTARGCSCARDAARATSRSGSSSSIATSPPSPARTSSPSA